MLEKRLGVEVEFTFDGLSDRNDVVSALAEQGLESRSEEYNHQTRDWWKVTTDSSSDYELVSPILDKSNAKTISPAMRAVRNSGGVVTDSCGLHVHVELEREFRDFERAMEIAALYHEAYEYIEPLLKETRIDNRFARIADDLDDWLSTLRHDRYQAVNVQCLNRQPTIEFRQFQGTLNASVAFGWMSLCETLTRTAEEGGDLDLLRKRLRYESVPETADMFDAAGVTI